VESKEKAQSSHCASIKIINWIASLTLAMTIEVRLHLIQMHSPIFIARHHLVISFSRPRLARRAICVLVRGLL
jgi:hypothetical protein